MPLKDLISWGSKKSPIDYCFDQYISAKSNKGLGIYDIEFFLSLSACAYTDNGDLIMPRDLIPFPDQRFNKRIHLLSANDNILIRTPMSANKVEFPNSLIMRVSSEEGQWMECIRKCKVNYIYGVEDLKPLQFTLTKSGNVGYLLTAINPMSNGDINFKFETTEINIAAGGEGKIGLTKRPPFIHYSFSPMEALCQCKPEDIIFRTTIDTPKII